MKTAVITGGSGGIGRAAAEKFAKEGYRVYELSRRGSSFDGVTHITADVTDEQTVKSAFEKISEENDGIDLCICNAGFGISGAAEFTELADAKNQLDVNFFGAFLTAKYALPLLKMKKGRLMFVSSAAAVFAIPFQSFYSASKAAVNMLSNAMRNELKPFGVSVCTLQLGDANTGFTDARKRSFAGDEQYGGAVARSVATMEKDERHGMSPEKIAGVMYKVAEKKRVRNIYTVGGLYRLFCFLPHILPATFVNFLVGKLYIPKQNSKSEQKDGKK